MPVNFKDFEDFKPDYTPKQMFEQGIFSGMYFRPIYSSITNKSYSNQHKEFKFLDKISLSKKNNGKWDISINKYNTKAGSSLIYWETHNWIRPQDPYGHLQWYCRFWQGRRTDDDVRQIKRANNILMRFGQRKNKSDRVKQALLQWGWDGEKDHSEYIEKIKKKK
jgi:hypothetical protein